MKARTPQRHVIRNRRLLAAALLFLLAAGLLFLSSIARAEGPQNFDTTGGHALFLERSLLAQQGSGVFDLWPDTPDSGIPSIGISRARGVPSIFPKPEFRSQTLDLLRNQQELSRIYEIAPNFEGPRYRTTHVNLYRNDLPLDTRLRLDLRISSKITLETRTRWMDAFLRYSPLSNKALFGVGRDLFGSTSVKAFYDPIAEEASLVIGHDIFSNSEISLALIQQFDRDAQLAYFTAKFRF